MIEVSLESIGKSYGPVRVLDQVSVRFCGGEVHGLVGENGAGKSTLARVLCGAVPADAGRITVDGVPVNLRSPRDAQRHGMALISQELALVPARSVLENVFLGYWAHAGGFLRRRKDRAAFARLVAQTGFDVEPDRLARDLSLAGQQEVEILRALARGARLIVMDEPTAALSRAETGRLLALVRGLAADGVAVVLISHFLEEVLAVADTVTVLRDGALITTTPAAELTPAALVRHMVGRPLELLYPEPAPVPDDAPAVLQVHDLARGGAVRGVDLTVRAGEIVGLFGLVGSGRTEIARLLFGADARDRGEVRVAGAPLDAASPWAAMRAGVAMVPESRKDDGLVMVRPVRENLAMASLGARSVAGFVRRGRERAAVTSTMTRVDIRAASTEAPVWTMSGGNQQKALFGKWLMRRPRLLVVDEPTRGVDVAAKVQIHRLLVELAAAGTAVLLISSEIEEVMGLSHRVLVVRSGRIAGERVRGGGTTEEILALAFADVGERA